MTIFKQKDNKKTKKPRSLNWVLVGMVACLPVLSVGIWLMLLLIVVGMSAVGWCIEKRWQHNRQPVIHTILGNQDAKDDDFQAERQ